MSEWKGRLPIEIAQQILADEPPEPVASWLRQFEYDCRYRAPEQNYEMVTRLGELVNETCGRPPLNDLWKVKMVARFMDISEAEAQVRFG